MDSSFFRRSSRDSSPLLPQHSSHALKDLSPRPYYDAPSSRHTSQASTSPHPSSRRSQTIRFAVPPPIAASVVFQQPRSSSAHSQERSLSSSFTTSGRTPSSLNPLAAISRREQALQADLQTFLDIQSAGLIQGRTGAQVPDDRSSDVGDRTPTSQSAVFMNESESGYTGNHDVESIDVIPVRQPRKKHIGLRGARRGIMNAMLELGDLKGNELDVVSHEVGSLHSALSQVTRWESQLLSFDAEMQKIEDGAESREALELQTEKIAVDTEIRELEDRLADLKARERHLGSRVQELENRREAKRSSFANGRQELESDVKQFLRKPPIHISLASTNGNEGDMAKTFLILPPKRRTLSMAKEWLSSSLTTLEEQKSVIEVEGQALAKGAHMWAETIMLVMAFEDDLRRQLNEGPEGGLDLKMQVGKMGTVLKELEDKALTAGKEGWNLLICAVGAELEAFREGEGILRGALEANAVNGKGDDLVHAEAQDATTAEQEEKEKQETDNSGLHGLSELQPMASHDGYKGSNEYRSESEDDGPDPDLLVSQADDDYDA